jgi:hypothetical protein
MNMQWDIVDNDMCLYLEGDVWKGFVFKDNKYYFDDLGSKNIDEITFRLDKASGRTNGNLKVPQEDLELFWKDLSN